MIVNSKMKVPNTHKEALLSQANYGMCMILTGYIP